jgi:RES domain-containing protein
LALDVEGRTVGGVWLRHMPKGLDPCGRPLVAPDGRWQLGRVTDALYLAGDEHGMWAEWYRHLAEGGLPPGRGLPREVWRYAVKRLVVADLSDADRLARVGLAVPGPGRGTWAPFQAIGERLLSERWAGLVAPSAARPGSAVLCVFLPRNEPFPKRVVPKLPPRPVTDPPIVPTGMQT